MKYSEATPKSNSNMCSENQIPEEEELNENFQVVADFMPKLQLFRSQNDSPRKNRPFLSELFMTKNESETSESAYKTVSLSKGSKSQFGKENSKMTKSARGSKMTGPRIPTDEENDFNVTFSEY